MTPTNPHPAPTTAPMPEGASPRIPLLSLVFGYGPVLVLPLTALAAWAGTPLALLIGQIWGAAILIFVGIKMSISHWYHINTYVSLAIIIAMLAAAIVFSMRRAAEIEAEHQHAQTELR